MCWGKGGMLYDSKNPFKGRVAVLVSQHGKQQAIAPAFMRGLAMLVSCTQDIDTDQLGTFTGERARPGTQRDTLLKKVRLGSGRGFDYLIASEGSYGPAPTVPYAALGCEMIAFLDEKRKLEIVESVTSHRTNFLSQVFDQTQLIEGFLKAALFPSHGLIVQPDDQSDYCVKGIRDYETLQSAIMQACAISPTKRFVLSADMRAHYNPTRMQIIRHCAVKLVRRLHALCPQCFTPGFGSMYGERGLLCAGCGQPTPMIQAEIWGCMQCGYQERHPRRDGLRFARQAQCAFCNP